MGKIYSKKGDTGFSSTISNHNLPKNHPIFEVLGTVDELVSAIGAGCALLTDDNKDVLNAVQYNLMGIMTGFAGGDVFDTEGSVENMEKLIDYFTEKEPLEVLFSVKGNSREGAAIDLARAIARRAERRLADIDDNPQKRGAAAYLNRLSDLLYILAKHYDRKNDKDTGIFDKNMTKEPGVSCFRTVTMESAVKIASAVIEKGRQIQVPAVAAVTDTGGNLLALLREENAYIASIDVAVNKAYTCSALKMSTKKAGEITGAGKPLAGLEKTNQGRIITFGGGIPLIFEDKTVGGLGVSGGTAQQDEDLAAWGDEIWKSMI